jgi:hypothetical protein
MAIKLQAREIVRLAKRQNLKLARGKYGKRFGDTHACALAVIRDTVGCYNYLLHDALPI